MREYHLAVDIGASSGRHILGYMEDGKLRMEEIYRFPNGMKEKNGHLCWDVEELFSEIKSGLKKCAEKGKIPVSMGIDTWAVDFVLLDGQGRMLGDSVGYRDSRTKNMDEKVYEAVSPEELYARTGIQKQIFNTVYQLMAVKEEHPEELAQAEALLMIPDYFHYLLTGVKAAEYTNATTTQLVNPVTKNWDLDLIRRLGYPEKIFQEIRTPGAVLGEFTPEIQREIGFNCTVILPATHDTGSAVAAVPSTDENTLYLSSGTWSLMGVELPEADCSEESRKANFTNEGGYNYRYRYLKNIMGLWMIQSVKKELQEDLSFAELCDLAEKAEIDSIVDCNRDEFLSPPSMTEAVKAMCRENGQQEPVTPGETARVVYRSLAECYKKTVKELEERTGRNYQCLNIVGGGSNAEYLNRLTAQALGCTVMAGPGEATALGNLLVQMLSRGTWNSLEEARNCIRDSFEIKIYN